MVNYLQTVLKEHNFPLFMIDEVLSCYRSIVENEQTKGIFDEILLAYREDMLCDATPLDEKNTAIAQVLNVHLFTVRLVSLLCLMKDMVGRFQENNIGEEVIYQTVEDAYAKALDTYDTYKVVGVCYWDWFFGFLRMTRFGLGRLQFELAKFRLPRYEKNGKFLTEASTVINVHIPRLPMPFTPENCEKAYQLAKQFFGGHFEGDGIPFVCWSWLLYPRNKDILPETSNVVKFLSRYDIIEMEEYTEAYNPVSHILFNREKMGDIATLPKDTSMRRRYAEFLQQGGKTGWGYGVFFLDKE